MRGNRQIQKNKEISNVVLIVNQKKLESAEITDRSNTRKESLIFSTNDLDEP
jgi:hypothetical protein